MCVNCITEVLNVLLIWYLIMVQVLTSVGTVVVGQHVEPVVVAVASVAAGLVVVAAVVAEQVHVLFVHGFSLIRTWLT